MKYHSIDAIMLFIRYPKTELNYIEADMNLERLSTYLRVLDREITRINYYGFDNNNLAYVFFFFACGWTGNRLYLLSLL